MKQYLILALALLLTPVTFAAEAPKTAPALEFHVQVVPRGEIIAMQFRFQALDLKEAVENLDNEEFYKDWVAYNVVTKKEIRVTDLTDKQKWGFYMQQGTVLHRKLCDASKQLKEATDFFTKTSFPEDSPLSDEDKKKIEKENEEIAKELSKILSDLEKAHKELAKKREKLVTDFIEKYKKDDKAKQLVGELQEYLKKLKATHDDLKLVDRKESK